MSTSRSSKGSDVSHPPDDPFSKHLCFLEEFDQRHPLVAASEMYIEPIEPLDTQADKWLAESLLDEVLDFQGVVKPPRVKSEEELNDETEEAMAQREPQFHLRNIGRAERYADPDAPLELERETPEYGLNMLGDDVVFSHRYDRPALLEELTVEFVTKNLSHMRWQRDAMKWEEYFCRELKDAATGPLWRRVPESEQTPTSSEEVKGPPSDEEV